MTKQKFYHLGDRYPGIPLREQRMLRAIPTGEKRSPKAGEWYISGAFANGYQAKADLVTEFYIAKIVKVEEETTLRIINRL